MHSCSVPYLLNLVPRISAEHEDTWLRYPWFFHALRPLCRQTPVEGGTPVKLLRFLPLLLLLCGCAREVSPVSALALDCKNGVRLDRRGCAAGPRRTTPPHRLTCPPPEPMTDALRNLRSILPGDLYLSHAQVLLFKRGCGFESILPLADYLCRRKTMCGSACGQPSCGTALPPSCWRTTTRCTRSASCFDRSAQDGVLPDMPLYRVTDAARRRYGHSSGLARGCVRTDGTGRHGSVQKRTAELLFRR